MEFENATVSTSDISIYLKVLSDETRLKICYHLLEMPYYVQELIEKTGMEQSAVSHQLKILRDEKIVRATRLGKKMRYELYCHCTRSILEMLQTAMIHREQGEI